MTLYNFLRETVRTKTVASKIPSILSGPSAKGGTVRLSLLKWGMYMNVLLLYDFACLIWDLWVSYYYYFLIEIYHIFLLLLLYLLTLVLPNSFRFATMLIDTIQHQKLKIQNWTPWKRGALKLYCCKVATWSFVCLYEPKGLGPTCLPHKFSKNYLILWLQLLQVWLARSAVGNLHATFRESKIQCKFQLEICMRHFANKKLKNSLKIVLQLFTTLVRFETT